MTYKILLIIFFIITFSLQIMELLIKFQQLSKPLPKTVKNIYSDEEYNKFVAYTKDNIKLSIISVSTNFIIMGCFLIFNIFSILFNTLKNDYLFIVVYLLISLIITIIFDYIRTMKLETKYGFNTSTTKRFISDQIIGFIISSVLFLGLIALVNLFYSLTDKFYPFICAGIVIVFLIIVNILAPIFLRIFNKFTPLEGPLREKLEALVTSYHYEVKDISICDASKRTTKSNAFCAGTGKFKRIAIYDNLLNKVEEDEIVAIFAHELAHAKHKDTIKNIIMTCVMAYLLIFVLAFVYKSSIFTDFGVINQSFAFLIVLFVEYGSGLLSKVFSPLTAFLSRQMEFEADKFACDSGYGKNLYTGLIKLCKDNLADLNPSKYDIVMNYSHPPINIRLQTIKNNSPKE